MVGLRTTGRDLLVIGLARAGFLAAVIAFVASAPHVLQSRMCRTGVTFVAVGAVLTVLGAIIHVALDGWQFDPFSSDGRPPVHSFMIGIGGFAFALGTVLTAIVAAIVGLRRDADRPAATPLLLGGILYLPAFPLAAAGHLVWCLPRLAAGTRLLMSSRGPLIATTAARASTTPGA